MFRKVFVLALVVVFALSLAGCASMSTVKQKDLEIQGLRNQVSVLETQTQSKDQEISNLKEALNKATEQLNTVEAGKEKAVLKVKPHPNMKDIQTALKNAGFYQGKIDGRRGQQTREAIKAFQRAHNLKVNGRVTKKTWTALNEYLNQKTK
ncbi:MAG: peptidoglycan-binding domain-containing protein [Candidatus Omnitrophica bacterium]|nr:peptidoglycan-binding domain-containing protein [Candidatus Omnitrophota bacterium]